MKQQIALEGFRVCEGVSLVLCVLYFGRVRRPTLWVEFEHVHVALGIDNHDGQLVALREEIGHERW